MPESRKEIHNDYHTEKETPQPEIDRLIHSLESQGVQVNMISGTHYNVFGLVGDTARVDEKRLLANDWVDEVTRIAAPYKLANRMFHPQDSVIDVSGVKVGEETKRSRSSPVPAR